MRNTIIVITAGTSFGYDAILKALDGVPRVEVVNIPHIGMIVPEDTLALAALTALMHTPRIQVADTRKKESMGMDLLLERLAENPRPDTFVLECKNFLCDLLPLEEIVKVNNQNKPWPLKNYTVLNKQNPLLRINFNRKSFFRKTAQKTT